MPASSTYKDRLAEYWLGAGRPRHCSTSAIPFSARVHSEASTAEKQTASPFSPWARIFRSLSLAVMAATRTPCCDICSSSVDPRSSESSQIMVSLPVERSRKKFPAMPWMLGGAPVMIETLLGLVNESMQLFPVAWNPFFRKLANVGSRSLSSPDWRYSRSKPSTHTTTVGCLGS